MTLTFIGIGDHDADLSMPDSTDIPDGDTLDTGGAMQLFTIRNLINFLLGIGWGGVCFWSVIPLRPLLAIVAILCGSVFVAMFLFMFKQMKKLEEYVTTSVNKAQIQVLPYVDQIAVLQQADVFLSHCGMNSVNESLYYQVPLIMYPQTSEQGGVATRVSHLGAGVMLQKNNPVAICEAVQQVIENHSFCEKAAVISEGFKKCAGAKGAADKILQVAVTGKGRL